LYYRGLLIASVIHEDHPINFQHPCDEWKMHSATALCAKIEWQLIQAVRLRPILRIKRVTHPSPSAILGLCVGLEERITFGLLEDDTLLSLKYAQRGASTRQMV
jgi:hypothetical protein